LEVVRLSDGTSFACTPSHRIWVVDHGWISAGSLQIGEKLLLQNQRHITISGLDVRHRETIVYNFEVADLHSYYVGKDSILVHNDCSVEAHTEFRTDPDNKVLQYETRTPQTNPRNPNPWQLVKRFDGRGDGHYNNNN
jgi:hypothetical protein